MVHIYVSIPTRTELKAKKRYTLSMTNSITSSCRHHETN